jgi:hypothetical protein
MKMTAKHIILASTLTLTVCHQTIANAHDLFAQSLGAYKTVATTTTVQYGSHNPTDYYQITCSDDGTGVPAYLLIAVRDKTAGTSVLSATIQKGLLSRQTTDVTGGTDTTYSPMISLYGITLTNPAGGIGIYHVIVSKNLYPTRNYDMQYHCMTADNLHTGTSIALKLNE